MGTSRAPNIPTWDCPRCSYALRTYHPESARCPRCGYSESGAPPANGRGRNPPSIEERVLAQAASAPESEPEPEADEPLPAVATKPVLVNQVVSRLRRAIVEVGRAEADARGLGESLGMEAAWREELLAVADELVEAVSKFTDAVD